MRSDEVSSLTFDESSVRAPPPAPGGLSAARSPPMSTTSQPLSPSANSRVQAFVSVPESHPLRRLRPFGCFGAGRPRPPNPRGQRPSQAPLTPPSPLKVSNPFCPGGGRGARYAPLSAPTRPPSPIYAGNVNVRALPAAKLRRLALRARLGATPWRAGGSLCRCSLQSAGQHSSPNGYLADSAASATPPQPNLRARSARILRTP